MDNSIGTAAGVIWRYLDSHGEISISKLTKEIGLETKLVQRGIGWLANEDKLTLFRKGRTEMVKLT